MKRKMSIVRVWIVLLVAGFGFSTCSSEDCIDGQQLFTLSVNAAKDGSLTRALAIDGTDGALLTTWATGEVVKVYKETTEVGTLTVSSGDNGQHNATLTGTVANVNKDDELTLKFLSPDYTSQDGTLSYISNHCDYAEATVTVTSISGTTATTSNAQFVNKQAIAKITFYDKAYTPGFLLSPSSVTITVGNVTTPDFSTTINPSAATYTSNGEGVIYVAIPGFSNKDVAFTAKVGDFQTDAFCYRGGKTDASLVDGKYYDIAMNMILPDNAPANPVDLGIIVNGKKILWADMNVGATAETDYGTYVCWGETAGKDDYSSSNYKWGSSPYTKYNLTDNKDRLEPFDDAARANWGGKWRMPTKAECQALFDTKSNANYTWTWCDGSTTKYNNTNAKGWKITRNSTNATIFLPAGGWRESTYSHYVGESLYYWSSSRRETENGAYYLRFSSSAMSYAIHEIGYSVRAVKEED